VITVPDRINRRADIQTTYNLITVASRGKTLKKTLKTFKNLKNLKTFFPKNLGFSSPALAPVDVRPIACRVNDELSK